MITQSELLTIGIIWAVLGFFGAILYLVAENIDGENITVSDILFIVPAGVSLGIFILVISIAMLLNIGMTRLESIKIISGRKRNKSNDSCERHPSEQQTRPQ